jgi:phosphatidylethanolamine-binding protein (PEBP) family uncharacterized protein
MRAVRMALAASMIAAGVAVAGCGGSSTSSTGTSGAQRGKSSAATTGRNTSTTGRNTSTAPTGASPPARQTSGRSGRVPTVSIEVSIPDLLREGYIPRRYTCDGADVSLPLRWSHVPSGTAVLAIFVIKLQPVQGRFFFDWALAGLSPAAHGISAGTLPSGAVVGRNSLGKVGYSICPPKGTREEDFVVRVLALPRPLALTRGFDAETLYREAERSAKAVGIGGGTYTRP